MDRIYFFSKEDCFVFFNEVRDALSVSSWNGVAKIIGKSRFMLENYRLRKLSIPADKFEVLLGYISKERRAYYERIIQKRNSNWGQILGGKEAFRLNKSKFDSGRKKACFCVKYDFDANMPISIELCELVGAIIGDGFTNKYGHMYQTQITGDGRLDLEYYQKTLKPICEKLFKISPKITLKDNTIRLNIYSKRLFEMLTNRFKIPAGVKCYSVVIPDEILDSGIPFVNSTLRGMFDTDGGVGLDKRKTYKKPYIRINYTSASYGLIEQIHQFLDTFGILHSINDRGNSKYIQINGEQNVRRFIKNIGFSNPRHLSKINYLLE